MGDPHYMVFDNAWYDYQQRCDYVLVRAPSLEIQVRHENCVPGYNIPVSCVGGVAFLAGSNVVVFNVSGAFVNGVQITSFPTTVAGVNITNYARNMTYYDESNIS
jgi:hypothetical protein